MTREPTILRIELPFPVPLLSPNSRAHWQAVRKAKKAYRDAARAVSKQIAPSRPWPAASVYPHFHAKDRRHYDGDNLNARLKAALDGVQDAGFVENDRDIALHAPRIDYDKDRPRVELLLVRRESRDNRQMLPLDAAEDLLGVDFPEGAFAFEKCDVAVDLERVRAMAREMGG